MQNGFIGKTDDNEQLQKIQDREEHIEKFAKGYF